VYNIVETDVELGVTKIHAELAKTGSKEKLS